MNQQVRQELKMKLWNIAKLIISIILLSSVIIVIFKFFGQCIGVLAGAVIVTLFVAYSLLDKEYRNKAMESSVGNYAILGYILLIIVLWLFAYGICVEFC